MIGVKPALLGRQLDRYFDGLLSALPASPSLVIILRTAPKSVRKVLQRPADLRQRLGLRAGTAVAP
jgi:hypothetical protein